MYKSNLGVLCLLILSLSSCKNTQKSNTTDNSEITEMAPETRQARFLLVHSAWLGGWQWEQVAKPLLEAGHYVFTPDLPGHGTDATPSSEISMERYVKTITDLLDTQKEPVILVGHSFNGITISRVAELHPEKIEKLVYLRGRRFKGSREFLSYRKRRIRIGQRSRNAQRLCTRYPTRSL
jgi:pimeloyl-ACP methyl ester carboxylesterase